MFIIYGAFIHGLHLTRVLPKAASAAIHFMENVFHPGSCVWFCFSQKSIDSARDRLARLTDETRKDIIFTFDGTESNHTAIW